MERYAEMKHISSMRMLGLLLHYFGGYLWFYRILATRITLWMDPDATILLPSVQLGVYLLTAGVSIALIWPILQDSWGRFRAQWKENMKFSLYLIVAILMINMLLSIVVSTLTQTGNSVNQEDIRHASTLLPLMTLLSTCVFAPIIEEAVFRVGVFSCLRARFGFWLSAILSSLLFGFIHVADSLFNGNLIDVSYLLVYAGIGMVLAYGYEKRATCMVPCIVHAGNNIISMLFLLL